MKIGIFDSGVGGFSILAPLVNQLPQHQYLYVADQANNPYSEKSPEQIQQITKKITEFLVFQSCQVIVIACNTATVISLSYLRKKFPKLTFVGTVPAVKPASKICPKSSNILVLSTKNTANGKYLKKLIAPYSKKNKFHVIGSTELVELIEKNDHKKITAKLKELLKPYKKIKISGVVIGCTHFSFIQDSIQKAFTYPVQFFDPTQGVIDQVKKVIKNNNLKPVNNLFPNPNSNNIQFFSSLPDQLDNLKKMFNDLQKKLAS